MCPSQHIISGIHILICLITGNVKFDHLVKVVSARFLHCRVTIFPCIINKYLERNTLKKYIYVLVCMYTVSIYVLQYTYSNIYIYIYIYMKETHKFVQITQTSIQHQILEFPLCLFVTSFSKSEKLMIICKYLLLCSTLIFMYFQNC